MVYRDYPASIPDDPIERKKFLKKLELDHLLGVWQWFEVYQLNPYVPPYFSLPKKDYDKKEEEGDTGSTGDGSREVKIKKLMVIYDFGDYLATSAGEEVGLLAYGRLLKTIDQMFNMLEKRGATDIGFAKDCFEPAKLYAWQKAQERNIKVHDYSPTAEDVKRLEKTYGHLVHVLEEVISPE
jgi:hypothetical protein